MGDADPQASVQGWAALAAQTDSPMPVVVGLGEHFHRPGQLDQLASGYDYVVLDTPPHNGETMRSALAVADLALLPVVAGAFDAWALGDSLQLVEQASTLRPGLKAAIVLNRSSVTREKATRQILSASGFPILTTGIGQRVDVADSAAAGLAPTTYAPRSKAAKEVRSLTDEVLLMLSDEAVQLAG
ncbi:MAG: AAA family ATPase [Polyangiaceae bacterium]